MDGGKKGGDLRRKFTTILFVEVRELSTFQVRLSEERWTCLVRLSEERLGKRPLNPPRHPEYLEDAYQVSLRINTHDKSTLVEALAP